MPYSKALAERVRRTLASRADVVEKQMFGGLAFMVAGSMACGILGDELLARVGREGHAEALGRPHTRVMAFTGRPMRGFVLVEPAGIRTAAALRKWVAQTLAFVTSPEQLEKAQKPRKKRAPRKKLSAARFRRDR